MDFRILGPLEVIEGSRPLALGGPRQRALLALLLTRANEVVSADRLIDALWGEQPPQAPANALHYHVSQLRKALAPSQPIETREPGYVIRIGPDELDLLRFERLVEQARQAAPTPAAVLLREALALWRGPALDDLAYESFAQPEILRLEELRLAALEQRIDCDLALGRNAEIVGEVEALVVEHPLRERLRAQLMLALYGSGRQVEALEVYQRTRRELVDELGIAPSPALQELEQAILRQDAELSPPARVAAPQPAANRAILVVVAAEQSLDALLAIAEPLAQRPPRELILVRLLGREDDLAAANAALVERRDALRGRGVAVRVAAYTTPDAAADAVLLAKEHDVDLLLADAGSTLLDGELASDLAAILAEAPCDVAMLAPPAVGLEGPVVTPFGGAEHEWSAIELAAWLAGSLGTPLRLLGTEADPARERRDASRLLARASLMVQQVVGIPTEPVLVPAGDEGVAAAAHGARLLVLGISERWRSEGIGAARLAVARRAGVPTLFVRRGVRPGGIAPSQTLTRFTWTLASTGHEPGAISPHDATVEPGTEGTLSVG